jgi:hypothetical protein
MSLISAAATRALARHRQKHGDQAAKGGPEQDEALKSEFPDQSLDVLQIGERDVGHRVLGIGALAPPAQLDADNPPVACQALGNSFEVAGVTR